VTADAVNLLALLPSLGACGPSRLKAMVLAFVSSLETPNGRNCPALFSESELPFVDLFWEVRTSEVENDSDSERWGALRVGMSF